MANTQVTFGFKHIGYQAGGHPDYQQLPRAVQSTYSTVIGFGDPVIRNGSTSPYIIQATAALATANPIEGIFVGCYFTPTAGLKIPQWSPFWPGAAAVDGVAYVIDAPNAQFLAAVTNTAITSGLIGQVANFNLGTPSTTGQGYSGATVDQSTLAAAGGTAISPLPFKILGIFGQGAYGGVGNGSDPTTPYNWVVVGFNSQINRSLLGY